MPIRILSPELSEKIAAGEVVERPASVVKELMENALDAQCGNLRVLVGPEIVDQLEVVDDGSGMEPDEVLMALERHATSKVSTEEDLSRIGTLGFRGEALPSIAAVSNMQIETRTRASTLGVRVRLESGRPGPVEEAGMPAGTRVVVRNLFRPTPARLKFLRSRQTENGHILDTFHRLALSRTDVSFQLHRAGKLWVAAPATQDLRQRAGQVFGWQFAEELRPVEGAREGYALSGLVGSPDVHRMSSRGMLLFVNRRPVRDVQLQRMIRQAYHRFLPKERYPVAILFFRVPLSEVDVNVHPAKMEVHFSEPARMRALVMGALGEALRRSYWRLDEGAASTAPPPTWPRGYPGPSEGPSASPPREAPGVAEPLTRPDVPAPRAAASPSVPRAPEGVEVPADGQRMFSRFRVIGQFHESYLLCEYRDNLLLIDQHAAHERIAFEKLEEGFAREEIHRQPLLVPLVVELPGREAETLERQLSALDGCGLEVDAYGGGSFAVKALPAIVADADPKRLLQDIAEELVHLDHTRRLDELRSQVFARMACHSVVRAGRWLEGPEMRALLEALDEKPDLLSCPHGRPIMISWSLGEIERRFHRT